MRDGTVEHFPGQSVPGDVSGLQLRPQDPAGIHDAQAHVLGPLGGGLVDHLVLLVAADEFEGGDLHQRLGGRGEFPLRLLGFRVGPKVRLVLQGVGRCSGRVGGAGGRGEHHGGLAGVLASRVQKRDGVVHHEVDRGGFLLLVTGALRNFKIWN